jgi:hypothetical protein
MCVIFAIMFWYDVALCFDVKAIRTELVGPNVLVYFRVDKLNLAESDRELA